MGAQREKKKMESLQAALPTKSNAPGCERRCRAVQLLLWSRWLRRPFPSSAPRTQFGDCDRLRPQCIHSSLPTRPKTTPSWRDLMRPCFQCWRQAGSAGSKRREIPAGITKVPAGAGARAESEEGDR